VFNTLLDKKLGKIKQDGAGIDGCVLVIHNYSHYILLLLYMLEISQIESLKKSKGRVSIEIRTSLSTGTMLLH
jgi:hypothetical protein